MRHATLRIATPLLNATIAQSQEPLYRSNELSYNLDKPSLLKQKQFDRKLPHEAQKKFLQDA